MKKYLSTTILAVGLSLGGLGLSPSLAQETCGVVNISNLADQASDFFAALDDYILSKGYDCQTEMISSTTILAFTSQAERGDPHIIPHGWIGLVKETIEPALKDGRVLLAAELLPDGGLQGWYIPKYVQDANPEIKTVEDALKRPDLFPSPEDSSRGAIHNGSEGWGITIATSQLYKAYDADKAGFDLISAGSSTALDGSMSRAYERGLGWLGVYWEPTGMMGKYDMVLLGSEAPLNQEEWDSCTVVLDCANPKPTAWPVAPVYTTLAASWAEKAPKDVLEYLNKRTVSNAVTNKVLLHMTESQEDGDVTAVWFLQNYPELWQEWVSEGAAAKIKASLS